MVSCPGDATAWSGRRTFTNSLGKVEAAKYARVNKIPFLGLCLGMQIAVIEFARNVANMKDAHSTEFNSSTPYPVIDLMPDQHSVVLKGGTMRLGKYPCKVQPKSKAFEVYKSEEISERHRHRYEVNNEYRKALSEKGMDFSGVSPDDKLVEMMELRDHPYFIACQFHPELKSRPDRPHPLFLGFVKAVVEHVAKSVGHLNSTSVATNSAEVR